MSRLLLLACSARKRSDPGRLPAIERYDGPAYRVLRRYVQSRPHDVPDVYILSAQFGLIHGGEPIPVYDRRMTPERAQELRDITAIRLQKLEPGRHYQNVCVHAGAVYREILTSPALDVLPQERLVTPTGSQGVQLSQLKSWLYQDGNISCLPESDVAAFERTVPVRFKFKGTEYEIAPAEVIAVARRALKNGMLEGQRATAWHVLIDGQRIPPKWLVSELTGLRVGEFHSIEARRVLIHLGMTARQA